MNKLLSPKELFEKFMETKFWKEYETRYDIKFVAIGGSRAIGYESKENDSDYEYKIVVGTENTRNILDFSFKEYHITIITESLDRMFELDTYNYRIQSAATYYIPKSEPILVNDYDFYNRFIAFLSNQVTKKEIFSMAARYFIEEQGVLDIIQNKDFDINSKPKVFYHLFYMYNDIYGGVDHDLIYAIKTASPTKRKYGKYFLDDNQRKKFIEILEKICSMNLMIVDSRLLQEQAIKAVSKEDL